MPGGPLDVPTRSLKRRWGDGAREGAPPGHGQLICEQPSTGRQQAGGQPHPGTTVQGPAQAHHPRNAPRGTIALTSWPCTSCGTIHGSCVLVVCSFAGEETTAAKEEEWDDDPGEEKRGFTDAQSRAADCGCGWGIQGAFPEKATFKLSCGDSQKRGERRHWRRDNGPSFRTEISWMSGPENRREGGCSSARKETKWSAHIP